MYSLTLLPWKFLLKLPGRSRARLGGIFSFADLAQPLRLGASSALTWTDSPAEQTRTLGVFNAKHHQTGFPPPSLPSLAAILPLLNQSWHLLRATGWGHWNPSLRCPFNSKVLMTMYLLRSVVSTWCYGHFLSYTNIEKSDNFGSIARVSLTCNELKCQRKCIYTAYCILIIM